MDAAQQPSPAEKPNPITKASPLAQLALSLAIGIGAAYTTVTVNQATIKTRVDAIEQRQSEFVTREVFDAKFQAVQGSLNEIKEGIKDLKKVEEQSTRRRPRTAP
jgi:uncharacterized protein HemX